MELREAIAHLDTFGYCLLENLISVEQADRMAERYFRLHEDPANRRLFQDPNAELYQTLFSVINLDEMCWDCIVHPQVLAVVRHFLGQNARSSGQGSTKWVKPGAPAGGLHVDSAHDLPPRLPDIPWMINTIWMITDFTVDNGATIVAPFSHKTRHRPPPGMRATDICPRSVTGGRGSAVLWQGGTWHANGANTSADGHRMGLNFAYFPAWWNQEREGAHPVLPEVFERMPKTLQELCRHRVGKVQSEANG